MYFTGLNIGGHFSQMEANKQPFENPFDEFITEKDFTIIKKWGFDTIRFPVDYLFFTKENGEFMEDRLEKLDKIFDWTANNDLKIILDLHKAPGHSFAFAERDSNDIWDSESANRKKFLEIWDVLSLRYKDRENVIYEILNEPVADDDEKWNEIADETIAVIRKNDKEHYIVIESNLWGQTSKFPVLKKFEDDKIIYSFHFYDPIIVTHQMAYWTAFYKFDIYKEYVEYPGTPKGDFDEIRRKVEKLDGNFATWIDDQAKEWNKDALEDRLKPVLAFKEKYNVPIFCGEFGCVVHGSPETRQNWTNDIIALFKKHKISYTYWNYKNLDFGIYDYTEVYASNKNYSEKERLDEGVLKALQSGIL